MQHVIPFMIAVLLTSGVVITSTQLALADSWLLAAVMGLVGLACVGEWWIARQVGPGPRRTANTFIALVVVLFAAAATGLAP